MKIISGQFYEGHEITVEISGKQIKRVARYNNTDGLYIVYKNQKYFEYEVED